MWILVCTIWLQMFSMALRALRGNEGLFNVGALYYALALLQNLLYASFCILAADA
jgi:hypothetical protein